MHLRVKDIRAHFLNELKNKNFTTDKTGQQTVELIGASFIADEEAVFGKPVATYIQAELDWYDLQSTNINDIYKGSRPPPEAWRYSADANGEINSNYGKLIYSPFYYSQYKNTLEELRKNPDGRRATMVYNRPSIWEEYNHNGKSDFICTNAVTYYIRDGRLHGVVQMRSNDIVFGYKNDRAWQHHVMNRLCHDLNGPIEETFGDIISVGNLYWQVQNLHLYSRHFHLAEEA